MSDEKVRLIPLDEACAALGISIYTLRRYATYERIKTTRIGSRVMVPSSELERVQREGLETVPLGTPLPSKRNRSQR